MNTQLAAIEIVERTQDLSLQDIECKVCGTSPRAGCNCGAGFRRKSARAAEAVKANPEKSDRAIAADIGVAPNTVKAARDELRSTAQLEDTERIGLDGKTRRVPERRQQQEITVEDELEPDEYRSSFLLRAADAVVFAVYSGPIDAEVIEAARRVASTWLEFVQTLEGKNG